MIKPVKSLFRILKKNTKTICIFRFENIIDLNFREIGISILFISNTVRNNLVEEMALTGLMGWSRCFWEYAKRKIDCQTCNRGL